MLIIFKAKRCLDVTMLADNGREILALLGKNRAADRGIVTVAQLPAAIAALSRATRQQRVSQPDDAETLPHASNGPEFDPGTDRVLLFQRARPVKALLGQALRCGTPVTWEI